MLSRTEELLFECVGNDFKKLYDLDDDLRVKYLQYNLESTTPSPLFSSIMYAGIGGPVTLRRERELIRETAHKLFAKMLNDDTNVQSLDDINRIMRLGLFQSPSPQLLSLLFSTGSLRLAEIVLSNQLQIYEVLTNIEDGIELGYPSSIFDIYVSIGVDMKDTLATSASTKKYPLTDFLLVKKLGIGSLRGRRRYNEFISLYNCIYDGCSKEDLFGVLNTYNTNYVAKVFEYFIEDDDLLLSYMVEGSDDFYTEAYLFLDRLGSRVELIVKKALENADIDSIMRMLDSIGSGSLDYVKMALIKHAQIDILGYFLENSEDQRGFEDYLRLSLNLGSQYFKKVVEAALVFEDLTNLLLHRSGKYADKVAMIVGVDAIDEAISINRPDIAERLKKLRDTVVSKTRRR